MSEDLQEKPAFCDIPGGPRDPNLKARCAKPDAPATPNKPADIRSKALTDTEKKRKRIQSLGLTHESEKKESFKQFKDRITLEANLNDYVKKYKMKMGDKTSTVDKDKWVEGIGGLTKREQATLKRVLQGHTREGVKEDAEFADELELVELAPVIGLAIKGAAAATKTPLRRAITKHVVKKAVDKATAPPPSNNEEIVSESKELQAKMALDDAKIKYKVEDGKIYVDKKDLMKAEKTVAKSFRVKPRNLDGKKYPALYYHGGSLGIWNKKRPITGMGR